MLARPLTLQVNHSSEDLYTRYSHEIYYNLPQRYSIRFLSLNSESDNRHLRLLHMKLDRFVHYQTLFQPCWRGRTKSVCQSVSLLSKYPLTFFICRRLLQRSPDEHDGSSPIDRLPLECPRRSEAARESWSFFKEIATNELEDDDWNICFYANATRNAIDYTVELQHRRKSFSLKWDMLIFIMKINEFVFTITTKYNQHFLFYTFFAWDFLQFQYLMVLFNIEQSGIWGEPPWFNRFVNIVSSSFQ